MTVLDRIDNVLDQRCPCGADPRPGSPYCGPDCEPTHISDDTDERDSGWLATPMRWRPDLVTVDPGPDLLPVDAPTHYTGRFFARLLQPRDRDELHLRLDDGHRWVGLTLAGFGGELTPSWIGRIEKAWQRLERELTDTRHLVPEDGDAEDPWADVMLAMLPRGQAVVIVRPSGDGLRNELAGYDPAVTQARRSYHNELVRAADVSPAGLETVGRAARQGMQTLAAAAEAFLRNVGVQLTDWQRQAVEQIYRAQAMQPRLFRQADAMQAQFRRLGFRPLANAREAAILAEQGLREGLDFLRYPDAPEPDEPPNHPMLRAIEAKKHRNTGPPKDRLDGRRRHRR